MKKKLLVLVLSAVMAVGMMSGCGAKSDTSDTKAKTAESSSAKEEETEEQTECELEDGTYTAEFKTDSGMFHVNEANDGKGSLYVQPFQQRSLLCNGTGICPWNERRYDRDYPAGSTSA